MVRTVSLKNFDYASHTDKGRVRDRNEDFLAYFDTLNGHVFVVCDGMGGHNAGDVASELAVEAVGNYFNEQFYPNPFEAVESAIIHANHVVYNHALGNDYLEGMGTTIVLVLIRDDRIYYGHAGDSRLYLYRNKIIDQMTVDHSHVQQLLSRGLISQKEAKEHPLRNQITSAIGLIKDIEPEVSPKAIIPHDDDILMLCSDGLTNMVEIEEISKVLSNSQNLNDKALRLISKANKTGGQDNISIQLIRFHNLLISDEPDEESEKPLLTIMRNLLKKRKIAYAVVLLFILGMSFFIGIHERTEIVTEYSSQQKYNSKSDLIIAYFIKPGEDFKTLAWRFNTTEEFLKRLNPNFEKTETGMHIKIPVQDIYVVQQVDELPLIVAKYQSDPMDILKANNLGSNNLIVGSEIIIPLKSKSN